MWPCVQCSGESEVTSGVAVRVFLGLLLVACGSSAFPEERRIDVPQPKATITDAADVAYTDESRMVIDWQSPLRHLNILYAPRLREISGTQNLQALLISGCVLERLEDSLAQLPAIRILKLVSCQMNGTLDLSLLFLTPSLTSLNLEMNRFEWVVRTPEPAYANQSLPLKFLDLSANALEHFDLGVMEPFTAIMELVLSRNRLISLVGEVQLPKLATLDLQFNRLTQVDLRGCDCQALNQMQFSRNNLTSWPMFASSSRGVKCLALGYNQLEMVNYTALGQHRNLQSLMLEKNAISSLHPSDSSDHNDTTALVELPILKDLFLYENHLEALELERWQIPSLELIRVDMNPLRYIPAELFQRCPKLRYFYCFCPDIECEWIELQRSHLQAEPNMQIDQVGPNKTNRDCIRMPRDDCVYCNPR
ncbi:leucine-rich repeat protein SHOC-2-like [Anopheles ziemanni]|uniref:leucine-rich repeat protein SHOC-2-like n=1 Tax=Anopheles coustani TaxID=139045 RepID=UPI0026588843|nr:leucine-rich repeat protein SHOC-2-like [Anopheles coustani]XP_058178779.1 leucine-rich repeat protein SHOC-2-like [Anopheles ziemanni]